MIKFLKCNKCGNIVKVVEGIYGKMQCCNEDMVELVPNSVDAAQEKHVPIYKITGSEVEVTVSEVMHPMTEEHYIKWILLETDKGYYVRELNCNDEPKAKFNLMEDENVVSVYSYCNLHGLWINK